MLPEVLKIIKTSMMVYLPLCLQFVSVFQPEKRCFAGIPYGKQFYPTMHQCCTVQHKEMALEHMI